MAQVNRISSFKSFTEVKNQEATMKLRETNNAKRQETVGKIGAILDEMGLTSLSELDEVKKQALINKMFGNVSEDEAEDIEDEINKLGEPKKLEEGNAFIFAASKAKQEGKTEFEFNGKKYKVTLKKDTGLKEGNAFGAAVKKAKEDGEDEFEVDGETYEIEEAKRTKFTGKTANDLYTQIGGKPVEVFVGNDWYSVNPAELKDDKGDSFIGYTRDGSDYELYLKDISFIQESLNEGKHGMAKKLLKGIVDGDSTEAEGIKLSKGLADHYLYWINTSAFGKKNENLPLEMLINASFNWGIERQLPSNLKKELEDLKASKKKNESIVNEARSIAKIQYDWSKLTTSMQATAQNWKAAEGSAKEMLLGKLKEMTAQKKALEAELDATIADKDKDLELVVSEAFNRLPKEVIGNELYLSSQNLTNLYNSAAAGNDIDTGVIDSIVKQLNTVKKSVKKFNNAEEVVGTVYEGKAKDLKPNHKYTSDYGEVTFIKLNSDGKTMKLHSKETGEIKTDISNAYNMELIESVVNEGDMTKDYDGFIVLDSKTKKTYKFKYSKGTSSVKVENGAIDKLSNSTGSPKSNFMVHGFVKKGEWNSNNSEVLESSIIEGQDPSAEKTSRAEQLKKLKALKARQEETDRIKKAQLKRAKATGSAKESVVAEGKDDYMARSGSADINIKKGYKHLVEYELEDLYNKLGALSKEYKIKGITATFESVVTEANTPEIPKDNDPNQIYVLSGKAGYFKVKNNKWELIGLRKPEGVTDNDIIIIKEAHEGEVTEAEVQSDDEFKEYAMTVLKKAFGDDFDEAKAGEVVDGILKKCGDDYGACVGMLTASLGESTTNEAFDANYWEDYHEKSPKITSSSKVEGAVEDGVWDWNDNNENGKENEVTPAGEKKVMKLAKDFFKAKGYICADIIDAMIAQES
jgi:hypothetical protein